MSSANLALRTQPIELWKSADWQRMWLSVWNQGWTSLAVLPAGPGAPPDFALTIAVTLARVGISHLRVPIQVADGTQVQLSHIVPFMDEVRSQQNRGELILIALPPVQESPASAPVAQAADNALLAVLLGSMSARDGKETIAAVGKERFIGSIAFNEPPPAPR